MCWGVACWLCGLATVISGQGCWPVVCHGRAPLPDLVLRTVLLDVGPVALPATVLATLALAGRRRDTRAGSAAWIGRVGLTAATSDVATPPSSTAALLHLG